MEDEVSELQRRALMKRVKASDSLNSTTGETTTAEKHRCLQREVSDTISSNNQDSESTCGSDEQQFQMKTRKGKQKISKR